MAIDFLPKDNKNKIQTPKRVEYKQDIKYVVPRDEKEKTKKEEKRGSKNDQGVKFVSQQKRPGQNLWSKFFPSMKQEFKNSETRQAAEMKIPPKTISSSQFETPTLEIFHTFENNESKRLNTKKTKEKKDDNTVLFHHPKIIEKQSGAVGVNLASETGKDPKGGRSIRFVVSLAFVVVVVVSLASVLFIMLREQALDNKLANIAEQSAVLQKQFEDFESRLTDFRQFAASSNAIATVLRERVYVRNLVSYLEKNTLPEVKYTKFSYSHAKISLTLEAPDYLTLSRQLEIFFTSPEVVNVMLSATKVLKDKDTEKSFISIDTSIVMNDEYLNRFPYSL